MEIAPLAETASELELPLLEPDLNLHRTADELLHREWLVTNGQGGYASGTIVNCNTRRYHGLFVPALEGRGRTVMLARLEEEVEANGTSYRLDGEEQPDLAARIP